MSRRRKRLPADPVTAEIAGLSHDGRGVAKLDGKAVFVHGALPGERVQFRYTALHRQHDEGEVLELHQASPERVVPRCAHFGVCGGCSLQHLDPTAQIAAKEGALLDALRHIGKVEPATVFEPLCNPSPWGYRRKARLGVRYVTRKGRVLVGFRERGSSFVTDLSECHVLHPKVGNLLPLLGELIGRLSIARRVPQIEVAMDDERLVLVFRVLEEPTVEDRGRLASFASAHDLAVYLQSGGPSSIVPLTRGVDLHYRLPEFDLELGFGPSDFTQVNTEMNRQMVRRATELLDPVPDDRVLDLFCGVGNFTLALATRAGQVVGVEGDAGLVARARDNARRNGLGNTGFHIANLYELPSAEPWLTAQYDKVLLDPPRSGAAEVLALLPRSGARRVLYVSCYPATLARDAGTLVRDLGYRLAGAGIMDMFPHTAHVESLALFEKDGNGH